MEAAMTKPDRKPIPLALVTALITIGASAAHIGVRALTSAAPGSPVRLAVTAALVLAFAAHVIVTVRMMGRLDEFQKSVQFTALAFAFPISMIAFFALGYFRAEGLLSEMDPRDLVVVMVVAYAAGLTWAWRRY